MHKDLTRAELKQRLTDALYQSERELMLRNKIMEIFLTTPDEDMYTEVLKVVLKALKSKYGVFGYIDKESGALVIPSLTRTVWDQCQIPNKDIVFPKNCWAGIWGKALTKKKTFLSNSPSQVPKGHIPIERSIAVPITHQGEVIGILHIANKATNYDNYDHMLLETTANSIAPILGARLQRDAKEKERKKTQKALKRKNQSQDALNAMLSIALKPYTLEEMLEHILAHIVSIPWLTLESRGAIFLTEDNSHELVLKTHAKCPHHLQTTCARIPFGKCLCGLAASTKKVQFSNSLDNRHEHQEKTMSNHGHYCIPIQSAGTILGVLTLYVKVGHKRDNEEEEFLNTVANGIAGIIERKRTEDVLDTHRQHLEDMINLRTAKLTKTNEQLQQEITERKQAKKILEFEREKLRKVYENSPDAVMILDKDFQIVYANPNTEKIAGVSFAKMKGKKCHTTITGDKSICDGCMIQEVIKEKKPKTRIKHETTKSGKENWLWQLWYPIFNIDGEIDSIVEIARNITERKKAEEQLKQSQVKYKTLIKNSPDIIITIDKAGIVQFINRAAGEFSVKKILGTKIYDYIIPEYHEKVKQSITQAFETGKVVSYEAIIKPNNKNNTWYASRVVPIKTNDLSNNAMIISVDITKRKQAQEALKKSEEQHRSLLENLNVGVYRGTGGPQGQFMQANPAMAKIFGYDSVKEFLEIPISTLYQNPSKRKQFIDKLLKKGYVRNKELKLCKKDKTPIWASCSAQVKFDDKGKIEWLDGVVEDITKRKHAEAQLKYEAIHDSLTSLFTRRYFMKRLETTIHAATRYNHALCICLCDLDDLKSINDNYGHQVGDEVISVFGKIVLEEVRGEDVPGRYGGDEFFILFPNVSSEQALVSVKRIHQRFQEWIFKEQNFPPFSLSATFALADLANTHKNGKDLLRATDQLLYQAKKTGRNKIVLLDEK